MAVVQNLPLNVPEIQGRLWISRHVQIEHVRSGFPAEISKESHTRLNVYAELWQSLLVKMMGGHNPKP